MEKTESMITTTTMTVAPPAIKTMFNYFTKLPSKAIVVEEMNPRRLAPVHNKQHVEEFQISKLERFDEELNNNEASFYATYLDTIKSGQHKPFRLDRKLRGPLRGKLIQYHEDVRPPYYGTWQRKSKRITGRRPFAMDDEIFDYEVDSEAEWDIGGPGESLKGDDSDDEEELDDYEIDMKTFVPHGYVSDDEFEVHSDQDEAASGNQSVEEICDVQDDSNASVKIVSEKGIKPQVHKMECIDLCPPPPQQPQRQTVQNQSPAQPSCQLPIKQAKLDIKPIILGMYYENEGQMILSENKVQFIKAFQGVSCN